MVSAHLGELGHGGSLNGFKPLRRSESEKCGGFPCSCEGEEPAWGGFHSEDLLVVVFEVVQEGMPFLECLCFHFRKGGGAGNEEGE